MVKSGWVCKESSNFTSSFVNRYAILDSETIKLYKTKVENYVKDEDVAPSKVFYLSDGFTVEGPTKLSASVQKIEARSDSYFMDDSLQETIHILRLSYETSAYLPSLLVGGLSLGFRQESQAISWSETLLNIKNGRPMQGDEDRSDFPSSPFQDNTFEDVQAQGTVVEVMSVNGMRVLQRIQGEVTNYMVKAIVRATPQKAFKAIISLKEGGWEALQVSQAQVIERVDLNTDIVYIPSGPTLSIIPRELLLLRVWRQDENGAYTVLITSTEHPAFPKHEPSLWNFIRGQPIRAQIQAGWTVSPVLEQHTTNGQSPAQISECLVTHVLQVEDKGRWYKFWLWLVPATILLNKLLATVAVIRDKVEFERFSQVELDVGIGGIRRQAKTSVSPPVSKRTSEDLGYLSPGQATSTSRLRVRTSQVAMRNESPSAPAQPSSARLTRFRKASRTVQAMAKLMRSTSTAADDIGGGYAPLDHKFYDCPGAANFKLRGASYLNDKKKIPSPEPAFELAQVEFLTSKDGAPLQNLGNHKLAFLQNSYVDRDDFFFILNLQVPGGLSAILYFKLPPGSNLLDPSNKSPFAVSLRNFLSGDDAARNRTLKLIPNVVEGNWLVKQGVGSVPVLLGRKLKCNYVKGDNYFEIDVNTSTSNVAASIVNLALGHVKNLVLDMAILFEGISEETLPEQPLGTEFEYDIEHRARSSHTNADVLSRYPRDSCLDPTGASLDPVNGEPALLTAGAFACIMTIL
ncbi:hypothetical protein CYMTET_18016 [Cymbomonas tetramitiformis]|uniref:START domain-containing protein n=1 Tax=Cymbomonas tetramitiformis TaxID=36881 RepID=A0AAE0GA83_9CHLO|nr:hypothetical protein CYMTET_18016 [Cymbomonas tetramitiformis]